MAGSLRRALLLALVARFSVYAAYLIFHDDFCYVVYVVYDYAISLAARLLDATPAT